MFKNTMFAEESNDWGWDVVQDDQEEGVCSSCVYHEAYQWYLDKCEKTNKQPVSFEEYKVITPYHEAYMVYQDLKCGIIPQ